MLQCAVDALGITRRQAPDVPAESLKLVNKKQFAKRLYAQRKGHDESATTSHSCPACRGSWAVCGLDRSGGCSEIPQRSHHRRPKCCDLACLPRRRIRRRDDLSAAAEEWRRR